MSFEKSRCNFIKKSRLKGEQIMLDGAINSISGGDFQKMLWINACPQIDSVEPLTKEISVSGKAMIEAVFIDSENKVCTAETSLPFLTKFINENVNPTTKINLNATISDINFEESNSRVSSVINFDVDITSVNELELLNGGDENICLKEDEIVSQKLLKDDCITFNEEQKVTITESFDRIISVCTDVVIKDITCNANFFIVQGELLTKIFYVICGETERIISVSAVESFKREIEVGSLSENSSVEIEINVKKENLKFEQENIENGSNVIITVPLDLCFKAYEEIKIACASDLFSLKNNLEIVSNDYERTKIVSAMYFESKIEGSISLSEKEPRIDKLLGVSKGIIKPTNQYIKDGEIVLEGIVSVNVVYLNDETQTINCVKKDLPYIISEKTEVEASFNICARLVLCDVDVIARRGRELFLDAKIKASVRFFGALKGTLITDAIMGEPLPMKEEAIEIYFGKTGDKMWDIAKELRTRPEVIVEQNPEINSPLSENCNIIIYHQKNVNPTSILLAKKNIEY